MSLALPITPTNLVLPTELKNVPVEGDLYNICERIKEVSPSLRIVPLIGHPQGYRYIIMELCEDHVERGVCKVHELDERLITHLRKLMGMPLSERVAQIERDEMKFEADQKEQELEELYENMGRQMWIDLEKCGFIQNRPVSFPKKGIKPSKEA
jgi:hypothetical protein